MIRVLISVLILVSLQVEAHAQSNSRRRGPPPPQSRSTVSGGIKNWQEQMKAEKNGVEGELRTQSTGGFLEYTYISEFSNRRWNHSYGVEVSSGILRGQGASNGIDDVLKNQTWMLVALKPGLIYRTTPRSSIGVQLPLSFRSVEWLLEPGSTLKSPTAPAFDVGVNALFEIHTSQTTSVSFVMGHNIIWASTLWSMAYTFRL